MNEKLYFNMKMENIYKYVGISNKTKHAMEDNTIKKSKNNVVIFLARVNFVMVSMNNLHTITFFWSLRDFFIL